MTNYLPGQARFCLISNRPLSIPISHLLVRSMLRERHLGRQTGDLPVILGVHIREDSILALKQRIVSAHRRSEQLMRPK